VAPQPEQQIIPPQPLPRVEQDQIDKAAEQSKRIEQIKRDQENEKLLKQQQAALEREKVEEAEPEPQVSN